MRHLLGWAALVVLLSPLLVGAWMSFSPDPFLSPPMGRWSLRWHAAFFRDSRWTNALLRSLGVALAASLVATMTGGLLALAVSRFNFFGRTILSTLALLPSLVPPVALAFGLMPLWRGSLLGLVLAHGLLGLPLAFLVLKLHFDADPGEREMAARGLGASPFQAFRRITLPLALPALSVSLLGAFVVSLNEGMVSLFLTTPSTETLPAVVWPALRDSASPLVAVASCASIAAGLLVVLAWRRR